MATFKADIGEDGMAADWGDWPQRRDRYLRWGEASNRERLRIIWDGHRGLNVGIALVAAVVGTWWFWSYVTAFGSWVDTYSETIRNLTLAAGVGAAVFGGWVAYQRSQIDRERAETDRLRQITDSFEGAVTLLGHEDRSVRLGAIYALERIARQNPDEHWPIMETLTAYVREKSALRRQQAEKATSDAVGESNQSAHENEPAEADIQAVFTVLGRRKAFHELWAGWGRRLNLSGAHLVEANPDPPPGRNFRGAVLARAKLCRADLWEANLIGAGLTRADLTGADLRGAALFRANLKCASLFATDLSTARGLEQEQLNAANGDENTRIPEDLDRPAHWSE